MNYNFRYEHSVQMEEQIEAIVDTCDKLEAEESATFYDYGENHDLILYIYKDEEYNREKDPDDWNLVTIHTAQDGTYVDDTEDTYVTDGSLHRELERIWNYRNFETL